MVVFLDAFPILGVARVAVGAAVDEVRAARCVLVGTAAVALVRELAAGLVVVAFGPIRAPVVRHRRHQWA